MKNTPMRAEPIVRTRKYQSRIPNQAKAKESRLKLSEATLLSHQISEAAGKQAAAKPTSIEGHHNGTPPTTEQMTLVRAKIDVGFGNALFIRGQGDGLSWEKGLPLSCIDGSAWVWSTKEAKDKVLFKLLLNDQSWAKGEDVVVEAGRKIEVVPVF